MFRKVSTFNQDWTRSEPLVAGRVSSPIAGEMYEAFAVEDGVGR
jgi:hypothetical protein